ncbi:hypothetical protein KCP74_18610 [Salmonella enterica subsp. enterica]|nr:hypothetical protein KCP74_18610 [Salmonella enterica subsp. enterica]
MAGNAPKGKRYHFLARSRWAPVLRYVERDAAIWAVMFFALERGQLIAGDGVFLSGDVVVMIFAILAADESEKKSGIRKSNEGEKSASVNACVRTWARCLANLSGWPQVYVFGQAGIPDLFKPSLPDI